MADSADLCSLGMYLFLFFFFVDYILAKFNM